MILGILRDTIRDTALMRYSEPRVSLESWLLCRYYVLVIFRVSEYSKFTCIYLNHRGSYINDMQF